MIYSNFPFFSSGKGISTVKYPYRNCREIVISFSAGGTSLTELLDKKLKSLYAKKWMEITDNRQTLST